MNKQGNPVGIKDVARRANVSISTVSNVLNGTKTVSPPLQERVLRAVKELNYETNRVVRGLKSGRTNTIAIVVPSVTSVFFPPLLKSIQTAANQAGYTVSVFGTTGDIDREKEYIQILKQQWIDGIFLSSCVDTDRKDSEEYIEALSSLHVNGHRIPLICLESAIGSQLDAVVMNDEEGIITAVEHVISLGRTKIAYIAAPTSFSIGKFRRGGYLKAMESHKLTVNPRLIIEGDYSAVSGYQCMQALLQRGEPLDAVVAGNDQMAIGAMRAILDAGYRIPEDISVIGYNDNFPSSLVSPSLSTIHVPKEEMGKMAFELFQRRLLKPKSSRMLVQLDGTLVIRNSTVASAKTSWNLYTW